MKRQITSVTCQFVLSPLQVSYRSAAGLVQFSLSLSPPLSTNALTPARYPFFPVSLLAYLPHPLPKSLPTLSPSLNFGFFPRRVFASKKTNSRLYWDSTSMSPSAVKCSLLICVYKHSSLCPLLHNALVTISHSFDNKVDRSILPNGTVTITTIFMCC